VMLRACKPFQIMATPGGRREPILRVASPGQATPWR
jgi:hypothetical protein